MEEAFQKEQGPNGLWYGVRLVCTDEGSRNALKPEAQGKSEQVTSQHGTCHERSPWDGQGRAVHPARQSPDRDDKLQTRCHPKPDLSRGEGLQALTVSSVDG